ncbi:MAG: glycine cleavage T C-terminal barrel domain-containing protein [Polyangiaceae bacterium]
MAEASVSDQVARARDAAMVLVRTGVTVFRVGGSDRQTWLNGLVTCELAKSKAGDAVYGLAVEKKGKVMADLEVILGVDHAFLVVDTSAADAVAETFEHHLVMEDAELERTSDAFVAVSLHGPSSTALLERARAAGAEGGVLDRTGLGGAIFVVPTAKADAILADLESSGGVRGTDAGWDALRLERGVPRFGVDFDGTTYPQEAGLEKTAISFSKGCYLGQEVVCMLELRGHVKRRLATLHVDGDVPARGLELFDGEGKSVGQITSAAYSPTRDAILALGMVKIANGAEGARIHVGAKDGPAATVVVASA